MTTDSEFMAATDRVLAAIGAALDAALAEADADVDWNLNDGILEIECEDGSKLIVNRHLPNREIWVAAKTGGFHFGARDGGWRDTRSGAPLAVALAALLKAQAGLARRAAAAAGPGVRAASLERATDRPLERARRAAAWPGCSTSTSAQNRGE